MFATMQEGEKSVLRLVLKTDVRGSLEAITHAINDISTSEVKALIIGSGVGGISESDAMLALTSRATIFGFNVRPDPAAKKIIERENVDVRYYSVIYELLDDIKQVLSGMLAPEIREEILGLAEVRDVFRSPRYGQVAGCKVRVLRDNVVIHEGELDSLRRFKDDVNEVRAGLECGIGVRNYDVKVGDKIEVFDTKEIARAL
jgi:translation initiation factor IF-2